jgi:glutamate synthase (NADPH/NADH) small chain
LAAAFYLNLWGEQVSVFERADRPGGLLMYGVPAMKLDKDVVLAAVRRLEQAGVEFKTNSEVGEKVSADWLLASYDAVVICTGAPVARMPNIPGGDLPGVLPAMTYLTYATRRLLDAETARQPHLEATDKDVFVIGNGDTATDCVATAVRQRARSITQLYYRDQPPAQRGARNPWPLYPNILRTDYGQQEAAAVYGNDPREYRKDIVAALADNQGELEAVLVADVEWCKDSQGLMRPHHIAGSEQRRLTQMVLVATGFKGPERGVLDQLGIKPDARGNARGTAPGSHAADRRGVFVAGDVHRGPSLVVWALKEGRDAAQECHEYLQTLDL